MQPHQLLYHGKNSFDTLSKLELSMSQKHPLGVEKVTTLVPFILESNPWGLYKHHWSAQTLVS